MEGLKPRHPTSDAAPLDRLVRKPDAADAHGLAIALEPPEAERVFMAQTSSPARCDLIGAACLVNNHLYGLYALGLNPKRDV